MNDDGEFPIEQGIAMPMFRTGWRQVATDGTGARWVAYQRPYPRTRYHGTGMPLKKRMRTWATCTICHVNETLLYDHYGSAKGELKERLCKACYAVYERSGHSSQYQQRIDDAPVVYANMAHYQEHRRSEPTGEQRLAAAIIASAAQDIWRETQEHNSKERAEAKEWLQGAKARVTFDWCCQVLDLDPEWARHMVYASAKRYRTQENKRTYAGYAQHPVEEYVPDVDGSDRSSPFPPTPASVSPTPESAIAAAITAIATYTG